MTWDGAGTFTRVAGAATWGDDRDASVEITAALHDTHDNDLSTGVNACLAKNGENAATSDINLDSNKLVNVTDPTNDQDAATKVYVDTRSPFAAGSDILWRGGTAPTGWAIVAINDRAVRIVNTADTSGYPNGGSPGVTFTTAFHATRTTSAVTLSAAQSGLPAHTHNHGQLSNSNSTPGALNLVMDNGTDTLATAAVAGAPAAASHAHTSNLGVLYEDFVVIRKS